METFVNGIYEYLMLEESVQKLLILLNEINFDVTSITVGISNIERCSRKIVLDQQKDIES